MTTDIIRCESLYKTFGTTAAVRDATLTVQQGTCLALLGPSGCGKTTLLRLIAGFEAVDAGVIEVAGQVVASPGVFVPPERRRVGIVFQDYALFPHLDVAGNIAYGLPKRDRPGRVREMLRLVGLAGFEARMPHTLSGGEQQRVALARALAPEPAVLLLDEPFSSLDADLRARTRAEVREILARSGATVILVTHDQQEALYMGDQVGVLRDGHIEQIDTPWQVYHRPATPFVARFVGAADFSLGTVCDGQVVTEVGRLDPTNATLASGERVRVLLRPSSVLMRPSAEGDGRIVGRVFQGSHYLYRIQLPSGTQLWSLQPCSCEFPLGTRVQVHIGPDQDLVCYAEGRASPCGLQASANGCGPSAALRQEEAWESSHALPAGPITNR